MAQTVITFIRCLFVFAILFVHAVGPRAFAQTDIDSETITSERPPEKVEADVSTRSIAVTSSFTGTEIVVFGSVDNSRQPSAEAGYYDVAIVIEGLATPLVARKKSNVGGLWVNTSSADFASAPSYYAIASTRPIEEIADEETLRRNAIGLKYVRLEAARQTADQVDEKRITAFKDGVVRAKKREGLYVKEDYAVGFVGRSLFRTSIELPANVPVGPLLARVYLFRDGDLLSSYASRFRLERQGIELWLHRFSTDHAFLYGLFTVLVAVGAGLAASAGFRREKR